MKIRTLADSGWAILPLRLVIGFGFAAHGYAKLARGPDQFAVILTGIGVPLPHVAAWASSLLEFGGGLALMAGAFVVPLVPAGGVGEVPAFLVAALSEAFAERGHNEGMVAAAKESDVGQLAGGLLRRGGERAREHGT